MKTIGTAICAMVVVLLATSVGLADLSSGLVAYYALDGSANDTSGNGNNGTPTLVGVTWTTGVLGGGVHLDGTGYIRVPDSPSLDLSGASGITFSAFVRVAPSSDQFGILAKESNSSFSSTIAYEFLVREPPTGLTTMLVSDGSGNSNGYFYASALADCMWHHVAASWVPGGEIRMYLDGALGFQGNYGVPVNWVNNTPDPLLIGAYLWQGIPRSLTGDMDEVRIYDRALSLGEIKQLSRVPAPGAVVLAWLGIGTAAMKLRRRSRLV